MIICTLIVNKIFIVLLLLLLCTLTICTIINYFPHTYIPSEDPRTLGKFVIHKMSESSYMYVHVYILMIMHTDISDLQKVQELLVDVKKEWYSLGLALGLRQPTLKGIKQNEDDIDDCKREMLTEWLNQVDNSKPTYPSLEVALEKDTVKCRPVANIVHKHYTQQN